MTEAELTLWSRLRRKQLQGVQFYRQRPIGPYIVDFYAPKARLVVEVDGSQHLNERGIKADAKRDKFLAERGVRVLRFDNLQILQETDAAVSIIYDEILKHRGGL